MTIIMLPYLALLGAAGAWVGTDTLMGGLAWATQLPVSEGVLSHAASLVFLAWIARRGLRGLDAEFKSWSDMAEENHKTYGKPDLRRSQINAAVVNTVRHACLGVGGAVGIAILMA